MKSREVQTAEFNIDLRCLKNKLLGFGKKSIWQFQRSKLNYILINIKKKIFVLIKKKLKMALV